MKRLNLGALCALAIFAAGPAMAQGTSNAMGKIVDADGNPVVDVRIKFSPVSNPLLSYPGQTNKKGRYAVSGLFTGKENDRWAITVEAPGDLVPTEMTVETRNVNRVLMGDVYTEKIRDGKIKPIVIRPLGTATVDFTLRPASEVAAAAASSAAPAAAAAAPKTQPKRDPWAAALTFAQQGNLEGSLEHFAEAIEDMPEAAERRTAMAKVLYKLERFDEAESQARHAIELSPSDVQGHLVMYSVQVGSGNLDLARDALLAAREVAPENVEVLKQLAFVARESGDAEAEVAAYNQITELDPANTEAWLKLGDLHAKAGRKTESEHAYQKVTELDPENAYQIFFNLGALIVSKSQPSQAELAKAIEAFRKAVELKPDYAKAHKELAFVLLNVGDQAAARDSLETYVKLAPEAPDAPQMQAIITTLQK